MDSTAAIAKIDPTKRVFGTNIRTYNPKTNQWEMAWISSLGNKVDTFKAIEKNGHIVMTGFYNGANTRITFFNMPASTFDWKMEIQSSKDKIKWTEVYRIHGIKKSISVAKQHKNATQELL